MSGFVSGSKKVAAKLVPAGRDGSAVGWAFGSAAATIGVRVQTSANTSSSAVAASDTSASKSVDMTARDQVDSWQSACGRVQT